MLTIEEPERDSLDSRRGCDSSFMVTKEIGDSYSVLLRSTHRAFKFKTYTVKCPCAAARYKREEPSSPLGSGRAPRRAKNSLSNSTSPLATAFHIVLVEFDVVVTSVLIAIPMDQSLAGMIAATTNTDDQMAELEGSSSLVSDEDDGKTCLCWVIRET